MIKSREPKWAYLLFAIGVFTILVRTLVDSRFANSGLLYIAVPFFVSFVLFQFTNRPEGKGLMVRYLSHIRDSAIVMLGTSALLFEGFLCVLMFMPIYFLIITIGFTFDAVRQKSRNRKRDKLRVSIIPLVIGVLAIEGLSPSTSFERQYEVTRTLVIDAGIEELKANMALPIELPKRRQTFLSLFPLPIDVKAGSLQSGDIHQLKFIYKRWFFTNIDEGEFHLRIDDVEDNYVSTSVVLNTSYLSKYLDIEGTEVNFEALPDGRTQVSLTVHYVRLLDPAWYFAPMQQLAVEQSADYLIKSVIARGAAIE